MTVRLHIERLVIDGAAGTRAEAAKVQEALAAELLARLSAIPPRDWVSSALPAVTLEPIPLGPNANAEQLGRQAGSALFDGLVP